MAGAAESPTNTALRAKTFVSFIVVLLIPPGAQALPGWVSLLHRWTFRPAKGSGRGPFFAFYVPAGFRGRVHLSTWTSARGQPFGMDACEMPRNFGRREAEGIRASGWTANCFQMRSGGRLRHIGETIASLRDTKLGARSGFRARAWSPGRASIESPAPGE